MATREVQAPPPPSAAAFLGFVCGLASMIISGLSITVVPFGIALAVIGVGLSALGRVYARRDHRHVSVYSLSEAGLVLGAIGFALGLVSLAFVGLPAFFR